MKQYEQELKLILSKRQYDRLTDGKNGCEQYNYYFCPKEGFALDKTIRIRKKTESTP